METLLLKLFDDKWLVDKFMNGPNDGVITFPGKDGNIKISRKSPYKVILEYQPKSLQDEKRELTRDEIGHHLLTLESKLTVDDAIRILQDLKENCGRYHDLYQNSTQAQYSVLVHPTNPIYKFEEVGKECPSWYVEKYGKE